MTFEKKKLSLETLSEYLSSIRTNLGLSVEDVAKQTGIKLKFLESLEEGEFLKLPPDVYVTGFLRQLALLYGVDSEILINQYKKERNIQQQVYKPTVKEGSWLNRIFRKLVITPKLVSLAVGALFVLLSLGYIIWQVTSIDQAPALEIFEPHDRQVIKGSSVTIRGRTSPGARLTVNDQGLFVDSQGEFQAQLGIAAGPKELVVTARSKFDKSTNKTISVVGEEEVAAADNPVQLKLEFFGTVNLEVGIDDSAKQTFTFHSEDVKQFAAQSRIIISTSDAGATKVKLNGEEMGFMGRPGEQLKNVPFVPETEADNPGDN